MKIVTIVGARPQFIKAAPLSRAILGSHDGSYGGIDEVVVHTGQHFDDNMSRVFFEELAMAEPRYNLGIRALSHGAMTGRMLEAIEGVLCDERPDAVLVYGDTNSTLAGALAAAKLHVPVAHVEAGLRSGNMRMPEELNRILTDRLAALLFCPTEASAQTLRDERVDGDVVVVGDIMLDASLLFRDIARSQSRVMDRLSLGGRTYALATLHRQENTDDARRLEEILAGLQLLAKDMAVVLPLHPRTEKAIGRQALGRYLDGLTITPPLPFLDMVCLEQGAHLIVTDSGGVQKEAYFYGVPCFTVRDETEWTETVDAGWNTLVAPDRDVLREAARARRLPSERPNVYGDGHAAERIVTALAALAGGDRVLATT
jgi:UDP-GlcNAc3NAcA epimerase